MRVLCVQELASIQKLKNKKSKLCSFLAGV